jgi:spermidine/putrescine transport system substrate-binding protein
MTTNSLFVSSQLGRRNLLKSFGAVAAAGTLGSLAAACGSSSGSTSSGPGAHATAMADEPGNLTIFDYVGNDAANLWKQYAAKQSKPKWTYVTDDGDITAKASAGKPWDIAAASNNAAQMNSLELLQPWDLSLIPNAAQVVPSLLDRGTIDGKVLQVPTQWGFESVMYRTDRLSDVEPTLGALFDDDYKGRIAWFDALPTLMVAAIAQGVDDPMAMKQSELDDIASFLISKKKLVKTFWASPTDLQSAFSSDDVWIAHSWPDSWIALKKKGMAVEFMDPKEGRMTFCTGFVLNKNSKNYLHAHAYVDAYLSKQAQTWQVANIAFGATNQEVDVSTADPVVAQVYGPDAFTKIKNIEPNQAFAVAKRYTETWQRVREA